jgi:hypothetical protein
MENDRDAIITQPLPYAESVMSILYIVQRRIFIRNKKIRASYKYDRMGKKTSSRYCPFFKSQFRSCPISLIFPLHLLKI